MSIREGKRTVNRIRQKVDTLDKDIVDAARQRARDHGVRFPFPDCNTRYYPDDPNAPNVWSPEIVVWQLSLLLGKCQYISNACVRAT